jgi:hypothetical protein
MQYCKEHTIHKQTDAQHDAGLLPAGKDHEESRSGFTFNRDDVYNWTI